MGEIIKINGEAIELDPEERALLTSCLNYVRGRIFKEPNLADFLKKKDFEGFVNELNDPDYKYINLAAKIIFAEYKIQEQDPGNYLIDSQTGLALGKINENQIFHPQEWTDENGVVHKPAPIVHPGITSSLGLKRFEETKNDENMNSIQKEIEKTPYKKHAFDHVMNPISIVEYAISELNNQFIWEFQGTHDVVKQIQIGKENLDNNINSSNMNFHRAQMYGQIIAMKLIKEFGKNFQYSMGMIEAKSNSKIRWFEVQVFIKLPKQLQALS